MKARKNSKNPLWIFAFFLFYIIYLIFLNLKSQNLILNLTVLILLLIFYLSSKIEKKFILIPIIFIITLIIFKLFIFIIRFDYFKLILNKKENYLYYFLNDLFFYLNLKDIVFYFNSFIYSFLIGNMLNELIIEHENGKEFDKINNNVILKNKSFLKILIFPKYFIETFYGEIMLYKAKLKRVKSIRKIKNKEKIIKKDYKKIIKFIDNLVYILKNIIKRSYDLWVKT